MKHSDLPPYVADAFGNGPPPTVWGPPAGRDEYFERNTRTQRAKIAAARIERDEYRREGNHAMADAIQFGINNMADTLNQLGLKS